MMCVLVPLSTQEGVDPLFSSLDTDGNGVIEENELRESQLPFFRRALRVADRDRDGKLSAAELREAVADPRPVPALQFGFVAQGGVDLRTLDRDGDGQLSIDEVPPALRERFRRLLDQLGQDRVSIDRVQMLLRNDSPESQRNVETPQDRVAMAVFRQLDRNQDGRLTHDEIPASLRSRFESAQGKAIRDIAAGEFVRLMMQLSEQTEKSP